MKQFRKCKSSLGVVNFKIDVIKTQKKTHIPHPPRSGCRLDLNLLFVMADLKAWIRCLRHKEETVVPFSYKNSAA